MNWVFCGIYVPWDARSLYAKENNKKSLLVLLFSFLLCYIKFFLFFAYQKLEKTRKALVLRSRHL